MANVSMRYETILVLNPNLGEEATAALVEKFKTLIADNGTIEKVEEWGKRRLAYPIQDELEGFYVLIHFESAPDFPTELNRVYGITDGLLRTLVVRNEVEQAAPAAEPAPVAAAPVAAPAAAPVVEEAAPAPAAEPAPAVEAAPVVAKVEAPAAEEAPVEEPAPEQE